MLAETAEGMAGKDSPRRDFCDGLVRMAGTETQAEWKAALCRTRSYVALGKGWAEATMIFRAVGFRRLAFGHTFFAVGAHAV